MLIKYLGSRTHVDISFNRKSYHFTKENGRTLDIREQHIINYIFSLPNSAEFQVIENSVPVSEEDMEQSIPEKIVDVFKKKAGRPKKGGN